MTEVEVDIIKVLTTTGNREYDLNIYIPWQSYVSGAWIHYKGILIAESVKDSTFEKGELRAIEAKKFKLKGAVGPGFDTVTLVNPEKLVIVFDSSGTLYIYDAGYRRSSGGYSYFNFKGSYSFSKGFVYDFVNNKVEKIL